MKYITEKQMTVLVEMFADNCLIFDEANSSPILRIDTEFIDKLLQIISFCKQLIIDAKYENIDFIDLNRLILKILFKTEEIRDTYSQNSLGYHYFNSIYDRILEGYVELANTL